MGHRHHAALITFLCALSKLYFLNIICYWLVIKNVDSILISYMRPAQNFKLLVGPLQEKVDHPIEHPIEHQVACTFRLKVAFSGNSKYPTFCSNVHPWLFTTRNFFLRLWLFFKYLFLWQIFVFNYGGGGGVLRPGIFSLQCALYLFE